MQCLLVFFGRLPIWARVLAFLIALGVLVALSPLAAVLAVLVFLFSIVALVVQLVRRRPVRRWGIAVGASLVAVLVFSGMSSALFPTNVEETALSTGGDGGERSGREETGSSTTRETQVASPTVEETASPGARREEATRVAPEPGSEPAPEPDPERTAGQEPSREPGAAGRPGQTPAPPQPASPAPQPPLAERGTVVTVSRAVDGDTVEVTPAVNGIEDVRLIGVDTPELSSDCGTQPLADEAAAFTRSQLVGQEVALELGSESTDRYGRLLAYVWTADGASPGSMFNTALLEEGYAQVYTVPPNDEYEPRFVAAQQRAMSAGRGIWGLSYDQQLLQNERGNNIGGGCVAEPVPEPAAPQPNPQPAPASPGSVYPPFPGDPNGDLTCSDVPPGPYSAPPGSDRDRDGDGIACESR